MSTKQYKFSLVTGADFARAIAESRQSRARDGSIIWTSFDMIHILSHTQIQKDLFVRNWEMPIHKIKHVVIPEQLYGIGGPRQIIFMLPGWEDGLCARAHHHNVSVMRDIIETRRARDAVIVTVTDDQVLRRGIFAKDRASDSPAN